METGKIRAITPEDLERAIRSVANVFKANKVIIIGSQALLVGRDDILRELRISREIDAYPANFREWETMNPGMVASEYISGLLGLGSDFHKTHGFFVDGVDDATASLPPGWESRAIRKIVESLDGHRIEAVAPEPHDLVAAKLVRGDEKDLRFAHLCLKSGLVKYEQVKARLETLMPEETLSIGLERLRKARHPEAPTENRKLGRNDGGRSR